MDAVIATLRSFNEVQYVEPVQRIYALGTPTDPYYTYQWHLDMLDIGSAHDVTDGTGATVAVLDTGMSVGSDGFNDFGNGYNCLDNNSNITDVNGHGSHVAGTIAQATSNGEGVAGMAPGAKIMAFKVLGDDGSGDTAALAECIIKAVWWGADVINMSLGGASGSTAVEDALALAERRGVTVVAATGNDGHTDGVYYPAAYDTVIAVGAVGADAVIAGYSNQGPEIDVVGPGGDMSEDLDNDGYADGVLQQTIGSDGTHKYSFYQGTSMASPHVAGAAALLYASGITEPADIRAALTTTSEDLGATGFDNVYGHGLIDVNAALEYTGTVPTADPTITSTLVTQKSASWVVVEVQADMAVTAVLHEQFNGTDRPKAWQATVHRWWVNVPDGGGNVRLTLTNDAGAEVKKWLAVSVE